MEEAVTRRERRISAEGFEYAPGVSGPDYGQSVTIRLICSRRHVLAKARQWLHTPENGWESAGWQFRPHWAGVAWSISQSADGVPIKLYAECRGHPCHGSHDGQASVPKVLAALAQMHAEGAPATVDWVI